MSLFLTGTWEHALLAMVVKEAAGVTQKQGGYLGRTATQKIVYFLQVLDVPMRYRFELYHYGPFCDNILGDLEWLMADEVISDSSSTPGKYSKYMPGPACDELIAMHIARLRNYEKTVKSTVEALVPLQPDHLELIATLDYAYRETRAALGRKPTKERVIARFQEFKGDKFPIKTIADTYDRVESAGLFNGPSGFFVGFGADSRASSWPSKGV
jgi:uncharacterized protein YwgA